MILLEHARLLFRELARWPIATVFVAISLFALGTYLDIEDGLHPALAALRAFSLVLMSFLFKGLSLFATYRARHGERFPGSFLLIAIMLAALSIPFLMFAKLRAIDVVGLAPPNWFFAMSTLAVVLFCWLAMRFGNLIWSRN